VVSIGFSARRTLNFAKPKSIDSEQTFGSTPKTLMPKLIQLPSVMLLSLAIPFSNNKVNSTNKKASKLFNIKKSYVQASKANISSNVEDVLQIKEAFPTLSADEVTKMIKAKNSSKR